jgi:integrase
VLAGRPLPEPTAAKGEAPLEVGKNERYRHLDLPDDLYATLVASLPPREDRELEAPLFPGLTDAALRMAITRACRDTGTPHFSPHGLRRRRCSLHYKRTGSLADVAELLGDSKRVAADHYVYALTDYREVDRTIALARSPGPEHKGGDVLQ